MELSKNLNFGFTEEQVREIYEQKCIELELQIMDQAEDRFVDKFFNSIVENKSLHFSKMGLTHNCIQYICVILSVMDYYPVIDLSFNKMQNEGALHIAEYLGKDPSVIELDLRSNLIETEGMVAILSALRHNSHLVSINFSAINGINRNKIETEGCKALAQCLLSNKVLGEINISTTGVTPKGAGYIGYGLKHNETLYSLDISSNGLGNKGIEAMLLMDKKEIENAPDNGTVRSFGNLESINFSRNEIGNKVSKILRIAMAKSKNLKKIDFSNNQFGKQFIDNLVILMEGGSNLESLDLSSNMFNAECIYPLEMMIRSFSNVKYFSLASNQLRDKGIVQLAEVFEINTTIVNLDISNTSFGNAGAKAMAKVIESNKTIQILNMSSNSIGEEGGIAIAKALSNNKTITELYLRNNELGDKSADAFIDAIATNYKLVTLDVQYNDFSYKALSVIQKGLQEHRKNVDANVTDVAQEKIEELIDGANELNKIKTNIKMEENKLKNSKKELEKLREYFVELQSKRTKEIEEKKEQLDKTTNELEVLRDNAQDKQSNFLSYKAKAESEEQELTTQYYDIKARSESMSERLQKSEDKRVKTRSDCFTAVNDLKLQLDVLKTQLVETLKECHEAQEKAMNEKLSTEEAMDQEARDILSKTIEEENDPATSHALANIVSLRKSGRESKAKVKKKKGKKKR